MDRNLPAFLDPAAYTIRVRYQHMSPENEVAREDGYMYVTNISGIREGDFVIVPTKLQRQDRVQPIKRPISILPMDASGSIEEMSDQVFVLDQRLSVAIVLEVHKSVEIEPNSSIDYKWVISKLDIEPWVQLIERNKKVAATAQAAYTRNLRRSFADRILGDMAAEERLALENLLKPKAE